MDESPSASKPVRPPDGRFPIVWAILVGGLVAGWALRDVLSRGAWLGAMLAFYFGPLKAATLIALTREERREWTRPRLLAYFLWVGMQPRQFLPSYVPSRSPSPTWGGCLLNVAAGAVLLWGVPLLFPDGTPLLVRAWTGLVGMALVRLFGVFDALALIFRALGFPVEKAWVNPLAATSLRDFWGRRWNRIMSGLLRDLLFAPLARRVGVVGASLIVFAYSGVFHEFVSVLARAGYGGPTVYFLIQGAAFACEGTRVGRRLLARSPLVGWCWTALVVVAPVGLVLPPAFMVEVIVPALRDMRVPGLPPDGPVSYNRFRSLRIENAAHHPPGERGSSMSTVTTVSLSQRLGVPPDRIRLVPAPGTATVADVIRIQDHEGVSCELIDGTLVEKAVGLLESGLGIFLARLLGDFVDGHNLGIVTGEAGTFELMPHLVRIPDVAFTSWDRLPGRRYPTAPVPAIAPNLAAEVLSHSNTPREMAAKRRDYFAAGVELVWELDPPRRTVAVYTSATAMRTLTVADTLDGAPVLPGFAVGVADVFAQLDRHG